MLLFLFPSYLHCVNLCYNKLCFVNGRFIMNESEKILEILNRIRIKKNVGIFDALMIFVEEQDIEIEDILPVLDSTIINLLKNDAINMNIVCNKKLFSTDVTSLF